MTDRLVALCHLDADPLTLDGIGVLDGDVGMFQRKLFYLCPRSFGLMERGCQFTDCAITETHL
jgi:hypothetical protein